MMDILGFVNFYPRLGGGLWGVLYSHSVMIIMIIDVHLFSWKRASGKHHGRVSRVFFFKFE